MIKIGQYNLLNVVKESAAGIYVDAGDYGELLLLKDDRTDQRASKEKCEVFLYYDSKEEVMATTQRPYGCVGEFACLKVVETSPAGAFLDWGLPKDLFVPLREQQKVMAPGERHIVHIDKDPQRHRLVASSRLNNYLNKDVAAYVENEKVDLLIAHETELGINAIVNHSHWGLLYRDDVFQKLKYGQKIDGYVKKVRANNKIDLSLALQGYTKLDGLEEKIMAHLKKNKGTSTITDKSSPEKIYAQFGVSKKKYKVALGSLYKNKRIVLEEDAVRTIDNNQGIINDSAGQKRSTKS